MDIRMVQCFFIHRVITVIYMSNKLNKLGVTNQRRRLNHLDADMKNKYPRGAKVGWIVAFLSCETYSNHACVDLTSPHVRGMSAWPHDSTRSNQTHRCQPNACSQIDPAAWQLSSGRRLGAIERERENAHGQKHFVWRLGCEGQICFTYYMWWDKIHIASKKKNTSPYMTCGWETFFLLNMMTR
jgi:hypothetical protein